MFLLQEVSMKERTADRRVKYTKAMLKNALVQLMQKQHISKISIKELCEIADVNRSTFYAHYTDQYDLLRQIEQEVLENFERYLEEHTLDDTHPVSEQMLTKILDYAKEDAELFKVLLSDHSDTSFQKELMGMSQVTSFPYSEKLDARTREYLKLSYITGCVSAVQKWLQDGMIESTQYMSKLILQILYHGIMSFQEF